MISQDNYSYFSVKPYVVIPHPNRLVGSYEGSQHMFLTKLTKIIPNYHQVLPLM